MMIRRSTCTALALSAAALTAFPACEGSNQAATPGSAETTATSSRPGNAPAQPVAIFVNNIQHGPKNGCRAHSITGPGTLNCGHPVAVTSLSWEWLGPKGAGDRWNFERRIESDGVVVGTESRTVVFDGTEPIILFEDDHQRITLEPDRSET